MKIRMLTSIAGIDFSVNANEETDRFSDDDAIRLIEAGHAVPVADPVERAVRKPVEKRGK